MRNHNTKTTSLYPNLLGMNASILFFHLALLMAMFFNTNKKHAFLTLIKNISFFASLIHVRLGLHLVLVHRLTIIFSLLVHLLVVIVHILTTYDDFLASCPHLAAGATSNFQWIHSFLIVSFSVLSLVHLSFLISAMLIFSTCQNLNSPSTRRLCPT